MSGLAIMLVDDHPIVREGYRRLLERREGFHVVCEAENAADAYRVYREFSPDVVVMDLSLPGAGGLEAVRHIRQWDRQAKILVFTMHEGAIFALKASRPGPPAM
ncbi:Response regulator UvrY [Methylobrevis pamukkalensis]|uniref:Response regulator UvrY n=1 Tax=Methylobrevis pamukkalensis TaxID=1439726 RepID=A0A1E3GWB4_9HYPH|nr:Response regulator UvrY [Methylobrevis pamukkalensis]